MAETLPALSTTRLKMRSGPAGTSATTSSASSAKGRETHPLHRKTPWLCWVRRKRGPRSRVVLAWARGPASQDGKPRKTISRPSKGAFRNLVVVRAAELSRVIARHTGERRVDVYERLITRWTEPSRPRQRAERRAVTCRCRPRPRARRSGRHRPRPGTGGRQQGALHRPADEVGKPAACRLEAALHYGGAFDHEGFDRPSKAFDCLPAEVAQPEQIADQAAGGAG